MSEHIRRNQKIKDKINIVNWFCTLCITDKSYKERIWKPVLSLSGGTEIGCALLVGYCDKIPTDGWLGAQALGIKVENGEPNQDGLGELCLKSSLPALPIGMINTGEQRSIKTSYFPNDVNIWEHGDLVRSNSFGEFQIIGRSDNVIKGEGLS